MKVGVYLDMTGNMLLVEKYQKFVWYESSVCLATSRDGYYKDGFQVEYGDATAYWDNSTQITFVLRDCVYLGKI